MKPIRIEFNGIEIMQEREYKENQFGIWTTCNKIIRCHCKAIVELAGDTECECGRTFNRYGQEVSFFNRSEYMNQE